MKPKSEIMNISETIENSITKIIPPLCDKAAKQNGDPTNDITWHMSDDVTGLFANLSEKHQIRVKQLHKVQSLL